MSVYHTMYIIHLCCYRHALKAVTLGLHLAYSYDKLLLLQFIYTRLYLNFSNYIPGSSYC